MVYVVVGIVAKLAVTDEEPNKQQQSHDAIQLRSKVSSKIVSFLCMI